MKIFRIAYLFFGLTVLLSLQTYSQFPEDVLRLSFPGTGVGARALGLGMAYTGVANDFSAIYWNPAGLGQLHMNELSFGLSNLSYGNKSTFFNNSQSFTNSATNLNDIGLVYSVPTRQGSFAIALGYGHDADFTTGLSFSGFNPRSSIIQSWAPDGASLNGSRNGNLAYELWLADVDSFGPKDFRWNSQIKDSLAQSGKVIEGGGLNRVSAAAAFEAAPDLFLGATVNVITGSYTYSREYFEDDFNNLYAGRQHWEFQSLSLLESVESDLSGFDIKLGMLYKYAPNSRIGFSIKTPSWITVRETFSQSGTSEYYVADEPYHPKSSSYIAADNEQNEYDATTPFVFSAGGSYGIQSLMVAADIEYTDWTQMEFRNANSRLLAFNTQIKEEFRPTLNLHLGAEYEVVPSILQLRGGFAYLPSPYAGDPSDFARKYVTGGLSFVAQNAIIIELGFARGFWKNYRLNYDYSINGKQTSVTNEDVRTTSLLGTVSYRF